MPVSIPEGADAVVEFDHRRLSEEIDDGHDVAQSVPVQPGVVGDHQFVLLADLDTFHVDGLRPVVVDEGDRDELEVGRICGHHIAVRAIRPESDADEGLGRAIARAVDRQVAHVPPQTGDVRRERAARGAAGHRPRRGGEDRCGGLARCSG